MNRYKRKAHAANPTGFWSNARRLLHAFAEAGQASTTTGLQLFMGPNGGLIWTDPAQIDRSEPYAGVGFSIPEKSAAHRDMQPLVIIRLQEPEGSPGCTPSEAPVTNQAW